MLLKPPQAAENADSAVFSGDRRGVGHVSRLLGTTMSVVRWRNIRVALKPV